MFHCFMFMDFKGDDITGFPSFGFAPGFNPLPGCGFEQKLAPVFRNPVFTLTS